MGERFLLEKVSGAEDLPDPSYMTGGASGMDLRANINGEITIAPGEYTLVPAGVKLALPDGFEAQVRPRSGLALKYGVTVLNSPGTIDSDYRGEVGVILINHGKSDFIIKRGDRIAQLVVCRVERVKWETAAGLGETERGGGYGHTGV